MSDSAATEAPSLFRWPTDDYYADHVDVRPGGSVRLEVGGTTIEMPIKAWHALAMKASAAMSDSKATTAEPALKVVLEQALDDGLWFVAETITEQYLQSALRRLHTAVESAHPPAAPEGLEQIRIWQEAAEKFADPAGDGVTYGLCGMLKQAAALLQSRDDTIERLRAELAEAKVAASDWAAKPCCQDFDNCKTPCVPNARHWREKAEAALAARQGG